MIMYHFLKPRRTQPHTHTQTTKNPIQPFSLPPTLYKYTTLTRTHKPPTYNTSPTILAASRYVSNNPSHFSLSFLIPSSS